MGANGAMVGMLGMCTMMVQLSLTLELEISDINGSSDDFYQAFIK